MNVFDQVYRLLPVWGQNVVVSAYGRYWHWLRFGGRYKEYEAGYKIREFLSASEWSAYQKKQLQKLVTIASEQVPYYHRTWSAEQVRAAMDGEITADPAKSPRGFCIELYTEELPAV